MSVDLVNELRFFNDVLESKNTVEINKLTALFTACTQGLNSVDPASLGDLSYLAGKIHQKVSNFNNLEEKQAFEALDLGIQEKLKQRGRCAVSLGDSTFILPRSDIFEVLLTAGSGGTIVLDDQMSQLLPNYSTAEDAAKRLYSYEHAADNIPLNMEECWDAFVLADYAGDEATIENCTKYIKKLLTDFSANPREVSLELAQLASKITSTHTHESMGKGREFFSLLSQLSLLSLFASKTCVDELAQAVLNKNIQTVEELGNWVRENPVRLNLMPNLHINLIWPLLEQFASLSPTGKGLNYNLLMDRVGRQQFNDGHLKLLSLLAPHVKELDLTDCKQLGERNNPEMFVPFTDLEQLILDNCPNICNQAKYPEKLKVFSISKNDKITDDFWPRMPASIKQIKLKECDLVYGEKGPLPAGLEELTITNCRNIDDDIVKILPKGLKKLDCTALLITSLRNKLRYLPKTITYLNLTTSFSTHLFRYGGVEEDFFGSLRLPWQLETLVIDNCDLLNDEHLGALPGSLKTLYLNDCSSITERMLENLPESLTLLSILNCPKIDREALNEWLESRRTDGHPVDVII